MEENEQLPSEFIVILLICSVALKRDCYGLAAEALMKETMQCYEDDYFELYSEAVTHLSKCSDSLAFQMVQFLIRHPQHQTVTNFILVTDHLCKLKDQMCLPILDQSLKLHPYSPELLAQRDYIFKCFGIGGTLREPEAIFYYDEDEPMPQTARVPKKRGMTEPADSQAMEKLIQNVEESLRQLAEEVNKGSLSGVKEQETVMDGLELFISLAPMTRDEAVE